MFGHDLLKEVRTRAEVCVEDGEERSICASKCVAEVACLLQMRSVVAQDVVEAKLLRRRKLLDGIRCAIVKDPDFGFPLGPLQRFHVIPGVLENFHRLHTDRKIDVDDWCRDWINRVLRNSLLVPFHIEFTATDGGEVRHNHVCLEKDNEDAEPVEGRRGDDE